MDYIIRAINKEKDVKIQVAITTELVEKARKTHNLTKTASAVLGRTLSAGIILAEDMKNEKDSITVNINGDGPVGRIVATAKNNGKIKGYVQNPNADADVRESDGKLDVSGLVGNGTLTVVRDLGMREPYVGQVPLVSGEIAEDFANYLYTSDQVPSVVGLGVLVDTDLTIKSSGGFILQLMPGTSEETICKIEENLKDLPTVTQMIESGFNAEDILNRVMQGFEMKILNKKEISFDCDCSKEKVEDALVSLGTKEIEEIIKEDKKAEIQCHFCNTFYNFDEEDLNKILLKINQINS